MRGVLAILPVALFAIAACSNETYPLPSGPPHAGQRNPAVVGKPITAVLIYLEVRPGDRIELLGAEAIEQIDGARVRFLLSRPVVEADGTHLIGSQLEDLVGAVLAPVSASRGPDNTVGIVAELVPDRPGRFELTNVRLRYEINGGGERVGQGIDVLWTVCASGSGARRLSEASDQAA